MAGPYAVDDTGPVLTVADIFVNALTATDLVVAFTQVSATDNPLLPPPTVVCGPASGSTFPLGTTSVSCTATDALGNAMSRSFNVTVVDTTPPQLSTPIGGTSVYSTVEIAVPFENAVSASDNLDPAPTILCTPSSNSIFQVGTWPVTCTAHDASNNSSVPQTFNVFVIPASAPVCMGALASPRSLWPPNHKLVTIGVTGVTNADGTPVTLTITGIRQDEPTNGLSDGDTPIDGFGVGTSVARVRSERSGRANGRVYYIGFTAATAGGSCSATVTTGVPHDQGKQKIPIGEGPLFDATH